MEPTGRSDHPSAFTAPAGDDVCVRCGGLMVMDYYMDLQDDTGQIGMTAWRCMSCGEVIDPVILRNRVGPAPNLLYGTKQRTFAQRVAEDPSFPTTSSPNKNGSETTEE